MVKKRGRKSKAATPGKHEIRHKSFWALLGIILLISLLFAIVEFESSTLTGRAVQTIGLVESGSQLHFEVRDVAGLKEVTATFTGDIKGGRIFFEQLEPDAVNFEGIVFAAFSAHSEQAKEIGDLTFTLKLEEAALRRAGISPNDLQLFANGEELTTRKVKQDSKYIFYSATHDSFGTYVIGKQVSKIEPTEETVPTIPQETVAEVPRAESTQAEPAEENIAGKAAESSKTKSTFFTKIATFFKNFFG